MAISSVIAVRRAQQEDLPFVSELFLAYRAFYQVAIEPEAARSFLETRLCCEQSVILVAECQGIIGGFCQLYPSWCSLALNSYYILYDLYVGEMHRRHGVGRHLLISAADFARDAGADRLELATAKDNIQAQGLYRQLGWQLDDTFLHFQLPTR